MRELPDNLLKEDREVVNKSIKFLDDLDFLLRQLPRCSFPGRYVWSPYSPGQGYMTNLAKKLDKPEYYGVAVPEHHLDTLEKMVDELTTEMIEYIESNNLVRKKVIENQFLRNVRFLLNRDVGNRPVMWFSGWDKFYSVFLNPSVLIPKRMKEN